MRNLTPDLILAGLRRGQMSGRLPAVVLFVDTSGFTPLTVRLAAFGKAGAELLADTLLTVFAPLVESVYAHGGFIAGFAGDAFKAIFPIDGADAGADAYLRALAAAEAIRRQMAARPRHITPYGDFDFVVRTSLAVGDVVWSIWASGAEEGQLQSHAYTFTGPAINQAVYGEQHAAAGDLVLTHIFYAGLPAPAQAGIVTVPLSEAAGYLRVQQVEPGLLPAPGPPPALPDPTAEASAFFSPDLLTLATQGEFRPVVSLFLNVQHLPEPETAEPWMERFFRLLHQYGGYLCRIGRIGAQDEGGTFLLFWGAPLSHENDVERALNFVLDLRSQSNTPLRAGITYQSSYAGFIGAPLREEYTCYGTGVNLAARQMVAAGWDEIWLDAATARRATGFETPLISPVRFKGFDDEQPVFALRGRAEQADAGFQGELLGRTQELENLRTAIQPIYQGRFAGVIVVTGEAGMGKSRLLHELHRQLTSTETATPVQWIHCPADEILRQPLNPFRTWLRHYFAQARRQGEAANRAAFDQTLDALITATTVPALQAELTRTRSFLAALVDLFWPDSLYAQVDAQLRFENTLIALKTLLLAESRRRPLVIELEDLQWLDDESQRFLQRLLREVADYGLVLLASSREEPPPGFFGPTATPQVIHLDALPAQAVQEMVSQRLGAPAAPALLTLLLGQSEGNPFFVEQLLLYLQEAGLLLSSAAGLAPATAETVLPADIQTVLVARLDRLAQRVKEVVQTAAVLGREFEVQVLSAMLQEAQVTASLQHAEAAAIWSALSELRYLFRHALLRKAAYEMQLQSRLRALHRLAAESIQRLYGENLAPYYADLAYHYRQAELPEAERPFARLAGEQAADQFANSEAVAFLSRALALTPPDQQAERFDLLAARMRVYQWQGNRTAQREDLATMAGLAEALADPLRQAEAARAEAEYAESISDFPASEAAAQRALALATTAGDQTLQARAHEHWARALWRQGRYVEAEAHFAEQLAIAQAGELREMAANALVGLGITRWFAGDYEQAQQHLTASLPIYAEIGKVWGQGPPLTNLGLIAQNQSDHPRAIDYLQQGLTIQGSVGNRQSQAIALTNLGISYQKLGEYDRALAVQQQALAIFSELDEPFGMMIAQSNVGSIYLELGDYARARDYYTQGLAICQAIGSRGYDSLLLANLAELDLLDGLVEGVDQRLQAALAIAQAVGYRDNEAKILAKLGRAALAGNRLAEAMGHFAAAQQLRQTLNQPAQALEALAGLAEVALRQQDPVRAGEYVEPILAYLQTGAIDGAVGPFPIYWVCYQTLQALGDERAAALLVTAHRQLQARAAQIGDDGLRRSFLEQVPAHRGLVAAFAAHQPGSSR